MLPLLVSYSTLPIADKTYTTQHYFCFPPLVEYPSTSRSTDDNMSRWYSYWWFCKNDYYAFNTYTRLIRLTRWHNGNFWDIRILSINCSSGSVSVFAPTVCICASNVSHCTSSFIQVLQCKIKLASCLKFSCLRTKMAIVFMFSCLLLCSQKMTWVL